MSKDTDIIYIDGEPFTKAKHEELKAEFFPPEGENFDFLKQPSSLTEEEKANLTPKQKQLYDTKEPAGFRKTKSNQD